jgi:putative tRNA adenosine deaminase-associated protein
VGLLLPGDPGVKWEYRVTMSEQEPINGFAVAAIREDGRWRCTAIDPSAMRGLDAAITELRKIGSTGAVVGMLTIDDYFFLLLRPGPGGVSFLLSDAGAALDYDIAADVLDVLRVEPPEEDDEPWPQGSLDILADLGLPEPELRVIIGEVDLYPDEQLQMIAQRCGFGDDFADLVDRSQL